MRNNPIGDSSNCPTSSRMGSSRWCHRHDSSSIQIQSLPTDPRPADSHHANHLADLVCGRAGDGRDGGGRAGGGHAGVVCDAGSDLAGC